MYGLDLFSGIGGITKALEGYVQPVAYCERDRYAQAVLLSRMSTRDLPVAPIWDDVTTLNGDMFRVKPSIIYGGFPCQDISVAGRGAGLEGKRSGLFFEIVRLIGEIRPKFVFLENVAAITNRGARRVVGELGSMRYDCRWGILSASDVGANHQRERWWLLAHSRCELRAGSIEQRTNGLETGKQNADQLERSSALAYSRGIGTKWQKQQNRERRRTGMGSGEVSHSASNGLQKRWPPSRIESEGSDGGGWWQSEPNVGRVAHGIPFRVDRLKGLGNAVVPAQAREAFERLMGLK